MSAVVGAGAGIAAVLFRWMVTRAELWREYAHVQVLAHPGIGFGLPFLCAALGGLAGLMTQRVCPEAGGAGIPLVKGVLLSLRALRAVPTLMVKTVAGVLALSAGASLGREGPTVHLGAALGSLLGERLKVPSRTLKSLVSAGAGAGLAAAFNAPLAGFLFIMEELRREMSRLTYGSALVASVTAVWVARLCSGQGATFTLPDALPPDLATLPGVTVVAVGAALVGVLFNRGLLKAVRWRSRAAIPTPVLGAVMGFVGGLLIARYPDLTGGGLHLTEGILNGTMTGDWIILICAGLLVGKMLFTVLCYGTGLPGGIFAPILTMGSLTGFVLGHTMALWTNAWTPNPETLATVGMAAMLSACMRVPLTGTVLIVEMTGQYHLIYPLLVASFIAYLVAEQFEPEGIYDALLSLDLHRPQVGRIPDAQVIEVLVEPTSRLDHALISHLGLHDQFLIALLERDGRELIPHGHTRLEAGDLLVVTVGTELSAEQISEFLELAKAP